MGREKGKSKQLTAGAPNARIQKRPLKGPIDLTAPATAEEAQDLPLSFGQHAANGKELVLSEQCAASQKYKNWRSGTSK